MGLFFPSDNDRQGPGRRIGFARYAQVLERDWKQLFLIGLTATFSFIPFGLGVGYAVLSQSVLVLIPASLLGGVIFGQGLAALEDFILRRLRDVLDDWWHCFCRSLGQNFRGAALLGAIEGLFIGFLIFAGALVWWSGRITAGTVTILAASVVIFLMVFSVWWPQVVLFDQKPTLQLKNCALFCITFFGRALGVSVLQTFWWAVMFLFLPWSAFLMPVLGVWYIRFVATFLLYGKLDQAFRIEEQIHALFPEQIPRYDEEE